MQVRLLTEADGGRYRTLRLASIEESPALSSPEIVCELAFFARLGKGLLDKHALEGTSVWGVHIDDRLAGVVAASRGFEHGDSHAIHLWGLYVHPQCRGDGVGALLLQAAIAWTRRQPSAENVVVYVNRGNSHALQLFLRFGFVRIADHALLGTRLCAMRLGCPTGSSVHEGEPGGRSGSGPADRQPDAARRWERVRIGDGPSG